MRLQRHDLFYYALCTELVLVSLFVGYLALLGVVPKAYAQAGGCFKAADVMAMLRRDAVPFEVYQDSAGVARGLALISEKSDYPIAKGADAILIVQFEGESQVAVSSAGVICGRIIVTEPFVRDLKAAILGKARTRDA